MRLSYQIIHMINKYRMSFRQGFLAFISLCLIVLLYGCTPARYDPLSKSQTVTFRLPDFNLENRDRLYWHSDLTYLYADAKKKPEDVRPFLKQEIQNYLTAKNLVFVDGPESAKYGLVAVVVLGDGLTASDVLKQFNLAPSFKSTRGYEKGTILVAFLDATTQEIQWRGALQGNVDLELAPEIRQQRVRESIRRLFKRLPFK